MKRWEQALWQKMREIKQGHKTHQFSKLLRLFFEPRFVKQNHSGVQRPQLGNNNLGSFVLCWYYYGWKVENYCNGVNHFQGSLMHGEKDKPACNQIWKVRQLVEAGIIISKEKHYFSGKKRQKALPLVIVRTQRWPGFPELLAQHGQSPGREVEMQTHIPWIHWVKTGVQMEEREPRELRGAGSKRLRCPELLAGLCTWKPGTLRPSVC